MFGNVGLQDQSILALNKVIILVFTVFSRINREFMSVTQLSRKLVPLNVGMSHLIIYSVLTIIFNKATITKISQMMNSFKDPPKEEAPAD